MSIEIRRVRADEWAAVRALRLDALRDPAANVAFLESYDESAARPDELWQQRTVDASAGERVLQLIATADETWVGTLTVLVQAPGSTDHHGEAVGALRANVVGVYVRPEHRGTGLVDAMLDAAATWARALGLPALTLDVHDENRRAQAAYRRAGFVPTGERFVGRIGPEIVMARPLQ
jgi:RimJ/RimL family protein N-acetyltransferase